ncbi:MAG TPA: hypothetical protein DCQ92_09695 [Verrucomicrobia subdivision 3 bacterium]|nr:hypothetical protein [Limisphaerales bacterium]
MAQLSTLGLIHTLMKKFAIIGFVVALLVASLLLWQHFKHPSDAKLARQISGTWTHGELFSQTISPDGSFSTSIGHSNALVTYQGTWLVKDQALVMTITNAQGTGSHRAGSPVGSVDSSKIIHVDDHQFAYETEGRTMTLTR